MLSRPFLSRIPDQSMIASPQENNEHYVVATRDSEGRYAMFYFPNGEPARINLNSLTGGGLQVWWYDPRTGNAYAGAGLEKSASVEISPPTNGKWNDWVLVVDAANYPAPGTITSD
jgi:hypothetical protein